MIKDAENRMIAHPPKQFRLTIAYGPYSKGQVITCNEPLRTILLRKKIDGRPVIEPVESPAREIVGRPMMTRAKQR